jgi:uncharacterized repeat protein (TIGR03833 family)
MDGQYRKNIRPGLRVAIIRKQDQRTGRRTVGVVQAILTSAERHTRGIKVRLTDGQIGRVQEIEPAEGPGAPASHDEGGQNAAS